jgi:hypothetical protein
MTELSGLDFFGSLMAASLTVMILSYLISDNPLFRLATHVFIGVAAGYAGTIAWHNVLKPNLVDPLLAGGLESFLAGTVFSGNQGPLIVGGWILSLLLILKLWPVTARWGTLPMALLVGVGAAVVVGGAITGTLVPQTLGAVDTLAPSAVTPRTGETGAERVINVAFLLVGTVSTLSYFHFTARKTPTGEGARWPFAAVLALVGRFFIAVTFGAMYAGVVAAAVIAFAERVQFLFDLFIQIAEFL